MPSEEPSVSIMSDPSIIPGSITIIPDPGYIPTGSITISSNVEFSVGQSAERQFSWRVDGVLEKEIDFQWNVGEGEYYWYRVEGECGKVNCENSGIDADQCNNVTFVTVVSARNVSEVCEILKSPRLNPPVNLRIAFIRRFSRPVLKGSVPDDLCNTLQDQEFCQIPECLDYCIDEEVVVPSYMSMLSIDFLEFRDMSGGFFIRGSSETNRNRRYDPLFPLTSVSGSSLCGFGLHPDSSGLMTFSGSSPIAISSVVADCTGSMSFSGISRATSPSYNYSSSGSIQFSGSSFIRVALEFDLAQQSMGIESEYGMEIATEGDELIYSDSDRVLYLSGSAESRMSIGFFPSSMIEMGGMAGDYVSPGYFYRPAGGSSLLGEADRNFDGLGTLVVNSSMEMSCLDFSSDFNDLSYASRLTISDATVAPPCGCGPLGLSLTARHNLFGSSALNNFFRKNNKILPSSISMKYRSSDVSWQSNSHFSGANESFSILFSLACLSDVWRFTFSARKQSTRLSLQSKFIVDIPSAYVCSDGRISTRISLGVGSPAVVGIPVVSPPHTSFGNISQTSVVVDGLIFDYVVYYDEIGLFKDSYWTKTPFEVYIEPLSDVEMPLADLKSIFQ